MTCQKTDFVPAEVCSHPSQVAATLQEAAADRFVFPEMVIENVAEELRQHTIEYAPQNELILQLPPVKAGVNIGQEKSLSDRPGEW